MNYSSAASSISSALKPIGQVISSINGLSFDAIWSGKAHDTLTKNLQTSIDKIKKQQSDVTTYTNALEQLQQYKDNKEKMETLRREFLSLNDEEDAAQKAQISSSITSLDTANNELKSNIVNALKSISSVSTEFSVVNYTADESYGEYVVDLYDFLKLFQSGSLTKLSDASGGNDSLYDYYSEEEVNNRINQIKQQYSGRDAAVNCALGIMQMAAQVGKKLDYDYGGGHVSETTLAHLASGVDCSSFVSWAINQGSKSTFNTMSTSGLINQGQKTSFEKAKKGDILVSSSHAIMVVDNDPNNQQFLVVEASSDNTGVIMQTKSYASLSGAYQARDLSSIYK